jgi:hypothetical protein
MIFTKINPARFRYKEPFYFFASMYNMNGETISPRVPKSAMNSENKDVPRVCMSSSIDGCLTAIGGFEVGDIIYIHSTEFNKNNLRFPSHNEVIDAPITGEVWCIGDVSLKLFSKLEITKVYRRDHNTMNNDIYDYTFLSK